MKTALKRITENPLLLSLALLIIAVIALFAVTQITKQPELKDGATVTVRIDRSQVTATVVASGETRFKGLSGTPSLDERQGMLFVVGPSRNMGIVMRNMNYPIDIIWISQGTVSEVTPDVQPQSGTSEEELTPYRPAGPVDHVLEVQSGWAAKNDVQPGDLVKFSSV